MRAALKTAKRLFDFLRAKITGDWWVPCPVCGDGMSGRTSHYGEGVDHKHDGFGTSSYLLVCRKRVCIAEARRQTREAYTKTKNNEETPF